MQKRLLIACGVVLGTVVIAAQPAPTARACVQGVWRIAEFTHHTDPTNARPQPSLYLFTAKHYSMLQVTSSEPRVAPRNPDTASAAELRAVWGNNGFLANAGSYETDGDSLTIHPVVAKSPDVMTTEFFMAYTMKCEGDRLVLTEVRDNRKAVPFPTTYKLSRVE